MGIASLQRSQTTCQVQIHPREYKSINIRSNLNSKYDWRKSQNKPPLPQSTEGNLLHKSQYDSPVAKFFRLKHSFMFNLHSPHKLLANKIYVCLQVQPQMLAMQNQLAELPRRLLCKFSRHKAQPKHQSEFKKKKKQYNQSFSIEKAETSFIACI